MIDMNARMIPVGCAALLLLGVSPQSALAQADPADGPSDRRPPSVFDGDFLTIGVGGFYGPSYDGSDDYIIFPGGVLNGRVGGIGISGRPAGLALDLIPDAADARVGLSFGPVARVRGERTTRIRDAVVRQLDDRDTAVELGASAGVSLSRITNPFDSLSIGIDVQKDVAGAHGGVVVSPSVAYVTPLSRGAALVVGISADHVDGRYARYYSSITAAESARTGLPAYDAGRGWNKAGALAISTIDFDGNLLNGGWSAFAGVGYTRMLGDGRRSPIVADRGRAGNPIALLGVGYTF